MPHIRVRGALDSTVAHLSLKAPQIAELVKTDAANFTFENIGTKFYESGSISKGYPFVEILWFPRSQEAKQAVADFFTKEIKTLEQHDYVTVIFIDLGASSYFENGKHF